MVAAIGLVLIIFCSVYIGYLLGNGTATRCPECGQGVVGYLGKCEICGYNPPNKKGV